MNGYRLRWIGWAYERAHLQGEPIGDAELRSLLQRGDWIISKSQKLCAEFDEFMALVEGGA